MSLALLAVAKLWFYWIGPFLVILTVLGILALMAGYYVKVVRNKYPRQ